MFKKRNKMTKEKQTSENVVNQTTQEQPQQYKDAFILTTEVGTQLFHLLQEMPIKYSNQILPLLRELEKAPRATITVTPKTEEK